MINVRRLTTGAAAVAVLALFASQVVSAAPTSKVGTSYWTNGAVNLSTLVPVASMNVPAGKYHWTASVSIENNNSAQNDPGAYINRLVCFLNSAGSTVDSHTVSVPMGGYASLTLDGVVDGSRLTGVFVDVECRAYDATTTPLPYVYAQIVGDSVAAIVDLR